MAEDSIRSIEDHSSQLCSKLFLETLYEKHPYGKMTYGSVDTLRAIDSGKLRALHRSWVRPDRLTLSISGPVPRTAVEKWLNELDRAAGAGDALPVVADEPALKAPRWIERQFGREQAHILVGGLGARITDEDRFALRLLGTLLGGQSGRLFIELREKKSLAYTVAPVSFEGIERGYVGTYIACAPGKREEAIAGIRTVLERFATKGASPVEMARARQFIFGRRAMDLQSDSAIASYLGMELLYGVPYLSDKEWQGKYERLTSRALQKACADYLIKPFMVTSVVG